MGAEARCTAHLEGQSSEGTALLETDFVLFRGSFRVKVPFKRIRKLSVSGEQLVIVWEEGTLKLDLGTAAGKWLRKIENPPSLMDKLGVKPEMSVCVVGIREEGFLDAVRSITTGMKMRLAPKSDMILASIESREDLEIIVKAEANLTPAGALWCVYPKGQKHITEADVRIAGKAAGLVDVKVAGFSATHTALKLMRRSKNPR